MLGVKYDNSDPDAALIFGERGGRSLGGFQEYLHQRRTACDGVSSNAEGAMMPRLIRALSVARTVSIARIRTFVLVAAVVSSACDLVDPLPSNAVQFSPPVVYSRWWSLVESCSGIERPMSGATWYVVPGVSAISNGQRNDLAGYWSQASNRIVLAGGSQFDGSIVRHEMLHAILGERFHSRESFLRRCAGIVGCGTECTAEAWPPTKINAGIPRVTAEALRLGLEISPAVPSLDIDDGFFMVTVTVNNPASHHVMVVLAPRGGSSLGSTFSYDLRGPFGGQSGGDLAFDAEALVFSPGETKRHVYDFKIGYDRGSGEFPPGEYLMRGGYDYMWGEYRSVTLAP